MNGRNGRLMMALGQVNGKYIVGGERNMGISRIIKVAITIAVIGALGLFLFLPYAPVTSDISAYSGSAYFPIIEGIEEYCLELRQPRYKNNFEAIVDVSSLLGGLLLGGADKAPGDDMEATGNGNYLESTDNQVDGVIESDLVKMTDKYIFRLDFNYLRVYSIDKENSQLVSEFYLSVDKIYASEMYLSSDCNTITVVANSSENGKNKVVLVSIDISDINNIKEKGKITIDGSLNTSRMADGKLILVTDYYFNRNNIDYSDPTTFVPGINNGSGEKPIEFEDIIYPSKVNTTKYSVVALLDAESLQLMGANALLNFTENVYVSENNVYITREYNQITDSDDGGYTTSNMSDIAVLDYSGERLEKKGVITVRGWTEDQYSYDEKDGYLRVVTSTTEGIATTNGLSNSFRNVRNASLYIFSLADNSLAYKVENFAPEGESATAVRFRGDELYVCTAFVVTFTDPVYFFDLSDYENITYTDTGIIEGYSDHLIDYGEGFLLGIGREDWSCGKVEIYAQQDDKVVSVYEYKFVGDYSIDYKSYLVNRGENLFGFAVNHLYEYDENDRYGQYIGHKYILISFDEEDMKVYCFDLESTRADRVRAVYIDGYLYITRTEYKELIVEKVD